MIQSERAPRRKSGASERGLTQKWEGYRARQLTKCTTEVIARLDIYERNSNKNTRTNSTNHLIGRSCGRLGIFYQSSAKLGKLWPGQHPDRRSNCARGNNKSNTPSQNMGLKIEKLMIAMAEHEGWHPVGHPQSPQGSRSFRHHNPGNLRRSPFAYKIVDNFAVFKNDALGWIAFQWDLLQKAKGNTITKLGPKSTLRELIFTWAPPSDQNNSEAYLQAVVKNSGISEQTTLEEIFREE